MFRERLARTSATRPLYLLLRGAKRFLCEVGAFVKSLCFILAKIVPFTIYHGRKPVLFNRLFGAGDVICTFPAALKLKERHPGGAFIYNCCADFGCLPAMAGVATTITSVDIRPVAKYWSFLFEAIYDFRWGDDGKNYYVTSDFPIETYCVQYGIPPTREHPKLEIASETKSRISKLLGQYVPETTDPLIVFHTGPSWPIREWPHAHWCELVEQLRSAGYRNIIRIGASKNAFLGNSAVEEIPGAISLMDELSMEHSIGLIAQAALLIGIDSGLLHMAAAVKTPFIGLWGPTTPGKRFSENAGQIPVVSKVECQGCHHRLPCLHWITGCPFDIRCMRTISVKEVVDAVVSRIPLGEKALGGLS